MGYKGQHKIVYDIFGEWDHDYSGEIDFAEFIKLATKKPSKKDTKE